MSWSDDHYKFDIFFSFNLLSQMTRMPSFFQVISFKKITALPSASIFDLKQFLFLLFFRKFFFHQILDLKFMGKFKPIT